MSWTTTTKNTSSVTLTTKGAKNTTWDQAVFTWDAATLATWGNPTVIATSTKHTSVMTNTAKS